MIKQKFNFSSSYKKIIRLLLLDKFNYTNSYSIPKLESVSLSIDLKSLDNFDSNRLIASMFILRILSNRKPYVTRFSLFQTFREKDYDASLIVNIRRLQLYKFIDLYSSKVSPFLPKLEIKCNKKLKKGIAAEFTLLDLSFIRVVEVHSVFFK